MTYYTLLLKATAGILANIFLSEINVEGNINDNEIVPLNNKKIEGFTEELTFSTGMIIGIMIVCIILIAIFRHKIQSASCKALKCCEKSA